MKKQKAKALYKNQILSNITAEVSAHLRAESRTRPASLGKARLADTEGEADNYAECQKRWMEIVQYSEGIARCQTHENIVDPGHKWAPMGAEVSAGPKNTNPDTVLQEFIPWSYATKGDVPYVWGCIQIGLRLGFSLRFGPTEKSPSSCFFVVVFLVFHIHTPIGHDPSSVGHSSELNGC